MTVQWARNPFSALAGNESMVGGVLEYTLRDGGTGAVVPLPSLAPDAAKSAVPVHLQLTVGNSSSGRSMDEARWWSFLGGGPGGAWQSGW